MTRAIIVGAGAAASAAALQVVRQGLCPLVVDVGHTAAASPTRATDNLYAYRRHHDSFDLHIGQELTGLANVFSDHETVAKLNAPNMRFVTAGADQLGPLDQFHFDAIQSFAMGGLGNAWGAGLYRFLDRDLADFPIGASDLEPYFDILTAEIGISGIEDDLAPYFGSTQGLLPPLTLSHNAARVYERYQRRREKLNGRGLTLGYPRLGVLSVARDGRPGYDYSNLEFWQEQPYLYTPADTLRKLIGAQEIAYHPGVLVDSWSETVEGISVYGRNLETGQRVDFTGDKLLLAAGAINTARIALQTYEDRRAKLPLLENPVLQVPFVLPRSIGRRLDTHAFGLVQLNLVWELAARACQLQGSLIELTAPMRSEFFGQFPLAARGSLLALRYLLPAMMVMQLYYPAWVEEPAWISLQPNGSLRIEGKPYQLALGEIKELLRLLRRLGLWTHPRLIRQPITGHAIHYAGTLPMREVPSAYECHPSGRLAGTERVYVADSASFSSLPAKNMSLAMMANAMRIAANALQA
jgi:choline dehydrogenase-like flavoprotein